MSCATPDTPHTQTDASNDLRLPNPFRDDRCCVPIYCTVCSYIRDNGENGRTRRVCLTGARGFPDQDTSFTFDFTVSMVRVSILASFLAVGVYSRPTYVANIPNAELFVTEGGDTPTGNGKILGHTGGVNADRSAFGLDYSNTGGDWSQLCLLDSDGDGRTNGEELGDPECVFVPGQTPPPITDRAQLSNPGDASDTNTYTGEDNTAGTAASTPAPTTAPTTAPAPTTAAPAPTTAAPATSAPTPAPTTPTVTPAVQPTSPAYC